MSDSEDKNGGAVVLSRSKSDETVCGIIMPISATATRTEKHWRDTQTLIHRGVLEAGFVPRNVWDSITSDRISERIIGNIFEVPIAIADISDLNPNVMLELGLRLASKKPTIVVAGAGCEIPFDIRDFHATFYPPDLNMLGMEEFFRKLGKVLQEKYLNFCNTNYTPFLGKVIIDVASPEMREVGVNELLISRLDDISSRISDVESALKSQRLKRYEHGDNNSGKYRVEIPESKIDDFIEEANGEFEVDQITNLGRKRRGLSVLEVSYSGASSRSYMYDIIATIAQRHGGDIEVPF